MGRSVNIVEYDPAWADLYAHEALRICDSLSDLNVQCFHIGSTAIPGMSAKPIIDILLAVASLTQLDRYNPQLQMLGYCPHGEFGIPGRRYYTKGGDARTQHVHAFEFGNPEIKRHLRFRDFLRESREDALAYATLKKQLAQRFTDQPQRYSEAKTDFIRDIDAKALDTKP